MDVTSDKQLEAMLARVLKVGTLLACGIIGLGLALNWSVAAPYGTSIVTAGLAIFLLLPCLRVLLMLIVFVRGHDYGFAAVAALVLLIILVALAIGAFGPARAAGVEQRADLRPQPCQEGADSGEKSPVPASSFEHSFRLSRDAKNELIGKRSTDESRLHPILPMPIQEDKSTLRGGVAAPSGR